MRILVEKLLAAQSVLLKGPPTSPEYQALVMSLREQIPAPILSHYFRLVEHDRKGVALVKHGVCTECHLRIPVGTACALAQPDGLHLCDNCGCYLFLSDEEISARSIKVPVVTKVARKMRSHVKAVAA